MKHPTQPMRPEDTLNFIESKAFSRRWVDLGLDDDVLDSLQLLLMANPKGGAVIKGTGGLRKLRFAPQSWNCGKSGALRVCYAHFEEFHIIVLAIIYAKTDQDDLTEEQRNSIRTFLERQQRAFESGKYW